MSWKIINTAKRKAQNSETTSIMRYDYIITSNRSRHEIYLCLDLDRLGLSLPLTSRRVSTFSRVHSPMLQDLFQRDISSILFNGNVWKGNLGVKMDSKQPSISSSTQRPIRVKVSRSIFDDISQHLIVCVMTNQSLELN